MMLVILILMFKKIMNQPMKTRIYKTGREVSVKLFFVLSLFFIGFFGSAKSQTAIADTTFLSYNEAQQIFVKNSFILLAQKYNIDVAKAAKKQAGLWSNPTVFAEINAYNPHTATFFNTDKYIDPASGATNYGSYNIQVNQLVQTAGKRNKLIAFAETNVLLQQQAFDELMREIQYQLFTTYSNLYFNQQAISILRAEEVRIKELVEIEKYALNKGATSGYEVTRLQFELQNLQSQINDYKNSIADNETGLNSIFCNKNNILYKASASPDLTSKDINIVQLSDSAFKNRPEIKMAKYTIDQSTINLRLQKAMSVPDLTFGFNYDRNGAAYFNYSGLNVSMPLPVFNRNQGNIQSAKTQTLMAENNKNNTDVTVQQDVANAYQKYINIFNLQKDIQTGYEINLQNISTQATDNYNKRIIGLLDYIDKSRTYRDAKLNLIHLQNNFLQSKAYINYTSNSHIF